MPRLDGRGVVSGSAWVLSGNLVSGFSLAALPIAVGFLGTLRDVGVLTLAMAITAPVVALSLVQLRVVMVVNWGDGTSFNVYRTARLATTLVAALIIAVIASLYGGEQGAVIAIIGAAKCIDAIGDCYLGYFQSRSRLDVMGVSIMANGGLTVLLVTGFMGWSGSIVIACWGSVLASAVASVAFPVLLKRREGRQPWRRDPDLLRSALTQLKLSGHLGIASALNSLNSNVPKYVIQVVGGTSVQGLFTAMTQIVLLMTMTVGSVSQATLPWFVRAMDQGSVPGLLRALRLSLAVCLGFGLLFVGFVAVVAGEVVELLPGGSSREARLALVWLAAASAVGSLGWFLDGALSTLRAFAPQVWLNCLTLGVTFGVCLVLVPSFGIVGAAQAVLVGSSVHIGSRAAYLWLKVSQ